MKCDTLRSLSHKMERGSCSALEILYDIVPVCKPLTQQVILSYPDIFILFPHNNVSLLYLLYLVVKLLWQLFSEERTSLIQCASIQVVQLVTLTASLFYGL